ncbi:MAG: putative non-heme bromoperoxidase BpoC [Chlamydiae bacterium]|nr:putative non-heme bromoperoxidase BpoC [Chlamydiota bacterium]
MPHLKANDLRIYYESHGDGPPLILISGFMQNLLSWEKCIPILSKHFRVIAFDNRGTGQTDAPEDSYSIEMFAQDTVALMDALDIESAHFMGSSMGTLIIQQLCLSHPEHVKKAVLCAPFSYFPPIAQHNVKMQLQLLGEGVTRQKLLELNMAWLFSNQFLSLPGNKEKFLTDALTDPYPAPMEGLLGQADALLSADLREQIKRIPHHILLLVGENDIDTPVYCAEYMKNAIPNCQMRIFKEMGHRFLYEIPEEATKRALKFLTS